MRSVLLINPNSYAATTARMLAVARDALPSGLALHGMTAARGPAMITTGTALADAAIEVVRLGMAAAGEHDALVVAAFGDPRVAVLRQRLRILVIGIGEAALREANRGGRRFGVATTTPGLVQSIEALVRSLGLDDGFTGVRVPDAPVILAADPDLQLTTLIAGVRACLDADGAEVVVIGGGPLSEAAERLSERFGEQIIAPVRARCDACPMC